MGRPSTRPRAPTRTPCATRSRQRRQRRRAAAPLPRLRGNCAAARVSSSNARPPPTSSGLARRTPPPGSGTGSCPQSSWRRRRLGHGKECPWSNHSAPVNRTCPHAVGHLDSPKSSGSKCQRLLRLTNEPVVEQALHEQAPILCRQLRKPRFHFPIQPFALARKRLLFLQQPGRPLKGVARRGRDGRLATACLMLNCRSTWQFRTSSRRHIARPLAGLQRCLSHQNGLSESALRRRVLLTAD